MVVGFLVVLAVLAVRGFLAGCGSVVSLAGGRQSVRCRVLGCSGCGCGVDSIGSSQGFGMTSVVSGCGSISVGAIVSGVAAVSGSGSFCAIALEANLCLAAVISPSQSPNNRIRIMSQIAIAKHKAVSSLFRIVVAFMVGFSCRGSVELVSIAHTLVIDCTPQSQLLLYATFVIGTHGQQ